jgi:hypothetical protein
MESWYLDHLQAELPVGDSQALAAHPKIAATVNCVTRLWSAGEKVLAFCHYIATGRALRQRLSEAIQAEILKRGAERMGCTSAEVPERLRLLADHFDRERPLRREADKEIIRMVDSFPDLSKHREVLVQIVRRYCRSQSFLVRFFPLERSEVVDGSFLKALEAKDQSGLSLRALVDRFLHFLHDRCTAAEREEYIEALKSLQPRSIGARDVETSFAEDELQDTSRESLLANIRLANGGTKPETRAN